MALRIERGAKNIIDMNKIKEQLNGNTFKIVKIIFTIVSIIVLILSQYRIYARVEFISELNQTEVKKLENKFDNLDNRINQNEKQILKNDFQNQAIKEMLIDLKSDLKEIRSSLLSLQRKME